MKKYFTLLFSSFFCFIIPSFYNISYSQTVRINEFMALNESSIVDNDGDYSDWIEIYNPTTSAVSLQGWALTDDPTLPYKWMFPDISINSGEYLIVYASSKNRILSANNLHTNFNLNGSGEYFALINPAGIPVSEFSPAFPAQQTNYSYGFYNNSYIEFSDPTPGLDNAVSSGIVIPAPMFSKSHGFYENPFVLEITSSLTSGQIYYTTNGSKPDKMNGILYSSPLNISKTAVIRAVIIDGTKTGKVATQSYLFADDIIHQPNNPSGYPTKWGPYTAISGTAIADYEMDSEMMLDNNFAEKVKNSLKELPTISLVTDISNLFSDKIDPETGGIYIYPGAPISNTTYDTGRDWERPVSVEYFDQNGKSLQENCGIRIQGGHGRRPEKSPKHSFILTFDSKYGPSKLNFPIWGESSASKIENIILRASFGNTWIHHDNNQRKRATYQEDIWTKDTQRAMGHPASNSIYAHLFINGIYWGVYSPSERMDKDFAENYMGGNDDDYDVIKDYAEVSDGNILAWNKMMAMANAGLESNENYMLIQGKNPDGTPNYEAESLVDLENLADYMLINLYGANSDWDHHNWSAMRNRVNPGKGFKFLCWDAELMFSSLNANILNENNANCPSRIYQQLIKNDDFKRLLADRIQRHCFNNGVLTPESGISRWLYKKAQLEGPILAESARWGDYRRDVHPYQEVGPFSLYNKENFWDVQENYMINTYFPQRTTIFINQLKSAGLFPSVSAPVFYINNKTIDKSELNAGDKLSMTATNGKIYYTTNGTDPVDWSTGNIDFNTATLYSEPIAITKSSHIVARTLYNGEWSAANKKFLSIPADFSDIKITEVHYEPLPEGLVNGSEFEFIELKNTGSSTLDLSKFRFTNGIEYTFPTETQLSANSFIVLASNNNYFYSRYKFRAFDEYNGQLDNNGETIVMLSASNDTIIAFKYNDSGLWPTLAAGSGHSMVPVDINPKNKQIEATDWRASYEVGGSPGKDDESLSAIPEIQQNKSAKVILYNNYPNPFSERTYISYQLPNDATVKLTITNIVGQQITTLVNNYQSAGYHELIWNGCDQNNNQLPNGIYFYKLSVQCENKTFEQTGKMILSR